MSTATLDFTRQQAEVALAAVTAAVDEFRAADLAAALSEFSSGNTLRIVWLRDLYDVDDKPQAWVVAVDDDIDAIDAAERYGSPFGFRSKAGSTLLNMLSESDEPLRKLAVGDIEPVDNPNGAGGYVATIAPSYTVPESALRTIAAQLAPR